ncbi:hypothetical protein G7Y89_g8766 [Cudoniella acicularis]|uniref:Uncharacterized protein n=1 Tax=Cudoniella acicularis TaxID=354080 RepID=A0A8H4RI91_9HELO|nr:hypothetical protein G7Y89_g8766 [Cudoniella acicularis]
MKLTFFLTCALFAIGLNAYALPKTILEGENGIIVEDDGNTKIDGETGITTNAQGQTTNIGGGSGITLTPSSNGAASAKGNKTSGAAAEGSTTNGNGAKTNGTGADGLIALLGALGGTSSSKKNGTTGQELPTSQLRVWIEDEWYSSSAPAEGAAALKAERRQRKLRQKLKARRHQLKHQRQKHQQLNRKIL